jgi:photosystem II stability/assembly factor-like uncharacterized protein
VSVDLPSYNLNDVFFVDARHGWIAGDFGTLLATSDGGATWRAQASGTHVALQSLFFVDARTGWVTGDFGSILITVTGGD